jgi:hypothetical protein
MDNVTLLELRTQCRQRADMENSNFIQDTELNGLINKSAKKLYDKLISAYADEYYSVEYSFVTVANQQSYTLPADFYKLLLVTRAITPTERRNVRKFMLKDKARFTPGLTVAGDDIMQYRLKQQSIDLLPVPRGGQTVYLDYIPRLATLALDADTLDAINGWDEYVILDVAIKMRAKEETDSTDLMALLALEDARIQEMKENRDASAPDRVSDVRTNAWGDDFDWQGGEW